MVEAQFSKLSVSDQKKLYIDGLNFSGFFFNISEVASYWEID